MVNVVCYGLGPIGQGIARAVLRRPDRRIVAAVDTDPQKVGTKLSTLLSDDAAGSISIVSDASEALQLARGGVVVHAAVSRFEDAIPQLDQMIDAGCSIISTCEQLAFPYIIDREASEKLDRHAQEAGVSVLGTGINPGYVMDSLPLMLTAMCTKVEAVDVRRIVDTNSRRIPLQQKVGVGIEPEEFRERAGRTIGHVGLKQSLYLLATGLGWSVDLYEESIEPVVAENATDTGMGLVPAGNVLGQRQTATGYIDGQPAIRFELEMSAGADAVDEIHVKGEPDIRQRIEGGINGDGGTVAVVNSLLGWVAEAQPGLHTMLDAVPVRHV